MRVLYFFIILPFFIPAVQAQHFHAGLSTGLSAYAGDLTESIFPKKLTKVAVGFSGNYELKDKIMLRASLTFAAVAGDDRYSSRANLKLRNLSFKTSITEFSAVGEYYILNLYKWRYSPYVFAGLALFHFNPYTYDGANRKVFLKPLSTEGQGISGYPDRKPYNLTQLAIPFGGGVKFTINNQLRVGIETGIRKLFTNYLDDISENYIDKNDLMNAKGPQAVDLSYRSDEVGGSLDYPVKGFPRGNPKIKDYYYFAGIHVTYRILGKLEWPWVR